MTRIQKSIVIAAAPEDIESYARYADSWPEWFPGVEAVQVDGAYPATNSVAQVSFRAAGTLFDLMLTVGEYLPSQRVTYHLSGMATGTLSFALAAEQVEADIEYELAGGVLGQIADRAVVENMVDSHVEEALHNMKAGLEG